MVHHLNKKNKFWLLTSFGNKDYIKEMKIANSVLLSPSLKTSDVWTVFYNKNPR